jgi:hypothetical protein
VFFAPVGGAHDLDERTQRTPVLVVGDRRTQAQRLVQGQLAMLLRLLVFKAPPPAPPSDQRATLRCACCGAPMRIVRTRTPPARRASSVNDPPTAVRPLGAQA